MSAMRREDIAPGADMAEAKAGTASRSSQQQPAPDAAQHAARDAYGVLHLHHDAPRDLIEAVYWHLVGARTPAPSESRIRQLNDAYATLIDADARSRLDAARPQTLAQPVVTQTRVPWLRLFASGKHNAVAHAGDYYAALGVARDAGAPVIKVAFEYWNRTVVDRRVDRALLRDAYRTLSEPSQRAQYDARGAAAAAPQPQPQPHAPSEPGPAATPAPPERLAGLPVIDEAPRPRFTPLPPVSIATVAALESVTPATKTDSLAPEPPSQPAEQARPTAAAGIDAAPRPGMLDRVKSGALARRKPRAPKSSATPHAEVTPLPAPADAADEMATARTAPKASPPKETRKSRQQAEKEQAEQLAAAQQDRLVALRAEAEAVSAMVPAPRIERPSPVAAPVAAVPDEADAGVAADLRSGSAGDDNAGIIAPRPEARSEDSTPATDVMAAELATDGDDPSRDDPSPQTSEDAMSSRLRWAAAGPENAAASDGSAARDADAATRRVLLAELAPFAKRHAASAGEAAGGGTPAPDAPDLVYAADLDAATAEWERTRSRWQAMQAEAIRLEEAAAMPVVDPGASADRTGLLGRVFRRAKGDRKNGSRLASLREIGFEDGVATAGVATAGVATAGVAMAGVATAGVAGLAGVAAASLTFVSGPRSGERVELDGEPAIIGSGPDAAVALPPGDGVAPAHARIWRHGDRFAIRQLSSAGMRIGGQELPLQLVVLDDGDDIAIGEHTLRYSARGTRETPAVNGRISEEA